MVLYRVDTQCGRLSLENYGLGFGVPWRSACVMATCVITTLGDLPLYLPLTRPILE
jgi:hypothetical protein